MRVAALGNVAHGDNAICLDYWTSHRGHQFSLISEAFLHGQTMIGQTTGDLLAWEDWLSRKHGVQHVDVCGISYGGDLAVTYPVFSARAWRLYASGTLGSFTAIFCAATTHRRTAYPASSTGWTAAISPGSMRRVHCDCTTANWMCPAELPIPRTITTRHRTTKRCSSPSMRRGQIYKACGAEQQVSTNVSPRSWHEMDIPDLLQFLASGD